MRPDADRFRFSYTVFTVQADLGPHQLVVKTGIKVVAVPVDRIQALYVHDRRSHDHLELLLAYTMKPGSRIKRARVFADREQPGFESLVAALLARRPETDIRDLAPGEAFTRMGAVEAEGLVIPGVMALATLLVAGILAPMLIHGADRTPPTRVSASALLRGEGPDTRNVVVTEGRLLLDRSVRAQAGADRSLDTISAWIPLVPLDWSEGEPVGLVLEVKGLAGPDKLQDIAGGGEWRGVVRDVLWEGLGSKVRRRLRERGAPLKSEVMLVSYAAESRHDLAAALGILGFLALATVGVFLALGARRPRRTP